MKILLKSCPFCGGEAHLDFAHGSSQLCADENETINVTPCLYMVFCGRCNCKTVSCLSPETAMSFWNRRAEET